MSDGNLLIGLLWSKVREVGPYAPEVVRAKFLAGYKKARSALCRNAKFGAWNAAILDRCQLREVNWRNASFPGKFSDPTSRQCV